MSSSASASASSSINTALSKSLDTRGIVKCEEYHGEKEKFSDWKKIFYGSMDLVDPTWSPILKEIEKNLEVEKTLETLSEEDKVKANGIAIFLLHLCKGDAATQVQAAEDENGFEAWRKLCKAKLPRSSSAFMKHLWNFIFTTADPRIKVQQWDKEALRYESLFSEKIPDPIPMGNSCFTDSRPNFSE